MKDFIEDLKYMCSSSNTTSRSFYIIVTVALIALLIMVPISGVIIGINLAKGYTVPVVMYILLVGSLAAAIGVIVWLKKS